MSDMDIRSGLTEEERLRLEKIDRLDSNKKRKKVIIAAVTAILILFFVVGTIFGAQYILSYEGTEALPEEEVIYPELPSSPEDIVNSFKAMLKKTESYGGVKLNVDFDVNIPDESIEITGERAELVKPYFDHIKSAFVKLVSSQYDSQRFEGQYGDDFSSVLFDVNYLSHSVDITSEINEENENDLKYIFDYYEETLTVPGGGVVFEKVFDVGSDTLAKNNIIELASSMVRTDIMNIDYTDFVMTVNADRLNEQINSIEQKRFIDVSLPLTFIGEYEEFGTIDISFTFELTKTFSFTRAGFTFKDDVYYIEKGSTDEFKYKVISDESPVDITVTLVSSDPSVLSVDGSFYKGEKVSDKPVTVTGTYTYNGITYEDTCVFYVRVPVEGVKVTEKEKALKVGESAVITAQLSPAEATLKDVFWFSGDENIVSVDENGEITAVSEGTASVTCITLDGNFRSVCMVTVTK